MTADKQPRTLTAEEVQAELLEDLRDQAELWTRAADEIKRLSKEVARLKDENGVIREQCQNMLDMTVR